MHIGTVDPGGEVLQYDQSSIMSVENQELTMVLHGPAVFDSGEAGWLMDTINPSRSIVAGVIARTAAEESNLPVEFCEEQPSAILSREQGDAFLVNRGRSGESGYVFGDIIAGRLEGKKGLVHVECSCRTVWVWNGGDETLAAALAEITGYELKTVRNSLQTDGTTRTIRGCVPGEPVFVNGIVVGNATAPSVILRAPGGILECIAGIELKAHGLEKLHRGGRLDLASAWCKSGSLRASRARLTMAGRGRGRILVIDHCGHELYRRLNEEVCGVLSIGDDTTAVCAHICAHRGIPVFGIVDGDCDGIIQAAYAPGSVVVEALYERDDDLGAEIAGSLDAGWHEWSAWTGEMLEALRERARVVADTREQA
jgi:hypothetical protein